MEEILMTHPDIAECAVFGVRDDVKGELPAGFVVTKAGKRLDEKDSLKQELVAKVRETLGPIACFNKVDVVAKLPNQLPITKTTNCYSHNRGSSRV